MDNKTFISRLSSQAGLEMKDVSSLIGHLSKIMQEYCAGMDTVAIPGFGSFVPQKNEETVTTDLSTGKRMLLPPEIILVFNPGTKLKKRLSNE